MFDVELVGEADLIKAIARADRILQDAPARAVTKAIEEAVREGKTKHAFKNQSGKLEKTIEGEVVMIGPGHADGVIRAGGREAPWGRYVDEGTAAHVIRPKAARGFTGPLLEGQSRGRKKKPFGLLAWESPQGDWHFAGVVHHPGTRPYGFMGMMYLKAERVLYREMEISVALAQRELGGG